MSTLKKRKAETITAEDLNNKNMKVRVNCWIDGEIVLALRKKAKMQKTKYQTLLNEALRATASVGIAGFKKGLKSSDRLWRGLSKALKSKILF